MTDPLNINVPLQGIDAGLPLLQEADYEVQCSESTVDANKREDGYNWNLKLELTSGTQAVDGREIQPGFPVFFTVALQPAPDSKDVDAFRRNLAGTIDALFGTTKDNRPAFEKSLWESAVGKKCIAHTANEEYPKGSGQVFTKVRRLKALPS